MGIERKRHDSWLRLLCQPVTMLSKRAITILTLVFASLLLLAVTSRSLGAWSVDGTGYTHLTGSHPKPPHNGEQPSTPPPPPPHHNGNDHDDDLEDHDDVEQHNSNTNPSKSSGDQAVLGLAATEDLPFRPHDPICDSFPDTSRVLVVMKTGATESYGKIPTQVNTMLKCLPEYFIFSDHEETIGGYHIRDSLDTILNSTMEGNRDFDLYRRQKACAVDLESCNKLATDKNEGWNLDKYKNVHMAEKVYRLRPNYDWYLFIDADTYVLFPTLMQWLPSIDHTQPHYLGSVTMLSGYNFAHGGSGYLVSQPAMKAIGDHPGIANELEPTMSKTCCGDYVFALSVDNTSTTRVRNMWPTVNGEKPFTLPYSSNHWCHPLVTMHHMNSEEISTFWEWESKRYADPANRAKPPITRIRDVYEAFMAPRLTEMRMDWDNKAEDRYYLVEDPNGRQFEDWELGRRKTEPLTDLEKKAHESPADCKAACAETAGCYMWRWQDSLCGFSWHFKMGHPVTIADEEKDRFVSGWNLEHIRGFIDAHNDCEETTFPRVV